MTQILPATGSAKPEPIHRLPASDRLLSEREYNSLSTCRVELASLSVALENGVTDASLRKLCASAVRRALGVVTP